MKKENLLIESLSQRIIQQQVVESENMEIVIHFNKKKKKKDYLFSWCSIDFIKISKELLQQLPQLSFLKEKKVIIPSNYQWIYSLEIKVQENNIPLPVAVHYSLSYCDKERGILGFLKNIDGNLNNCYPAYYELHNEQVIVSPLLQFSRINIESLRNFLSQYYSISMDSLSFLEMKKLKNIDYGDKQYLIFQCIAQPDNLYGFIYQ